MLFCLQQRNAMDQTLVRALMFGLVCRHQSLPNQSNEESERTHLPARPPPAYTFVLVLPIRCPFSETSHSDSNPSDNEEILFIHYNCLQIQIWFHNCPTVNQKTSTQIISFLDGGWQDCRSFSGHIVLIESSGIQCCALTIPFQQTGHI